MNLHVAERTDNEKSEKPSKIRRMSKNAAAPTESGSTEYKVEDVAHQPSSHQRTAVVPDRPQSVSNQPTQSVTTAYNVNGICTKDSVLVPRRFLQRPPLTFD